MKSKPSWSSLPIFLSKNCRKKQLDVFNTVLRMREQRMNMVQKPEQYLYIFKCLRDEIRSATAVGDYYYDV